MSKVFDAYAAYYDLLYQDKDYVGEVEFLEELLATNGVKQGELLELGSGTGKHAELLAGKGFKIHGIDLSESMINQAGERIAALIPEVANNISFEQGDVRSVRTNRFYSAVISLFHVASYQTSNDDLLQMFATAATHLEKGGLFIFDCWYGPAVLNERPETRVKRLSDNKIDVLRIAEPVQNVNENLVQVNYTVLITDKSSDVTEKISEQHVMRYLFFPELKLLLENSDLEIIKSMEWMTGKALNDHSWSATFVTRRC